jgi:hypothetical protein
LEIIYEDKKDYHEDDSKSEDVRLFKHSSILSKEKNFDQTELSLMSPVMLPSVI